jgi:predicted RND superfamily exporter protein
MSTLRARKLKETNQVIKLVKDLNKRMETFEDAVQELKILKDSIAEMNDQIAEQEASNVETMRKLREDLKENKLKALTETVAGIGKVIISPEDLAEHKGEAQRWKDECARVKASVQKEIKEAVDDQMARRLKIQELEFENKTAKLSASCESYKAEIVNLKDTIARMSQELDSQKKLTADVARVRTGTADAKQN